MKQQNKTLWIIVAVIIGITLLHNYNPGLFAVSSVRYSTYSTNPNVSIGSCWNSKTIVSITPIVKSTRTTYKVGYTSGCDCEVLSKDNKLDSNTIVVLLDEGAVSKLNTVSSVLSKMDPPIKNYKYVFYSERYDGACEGQIANYSCRPMFKVYSDLANTWARGTASMGFQNLKLSTRVKSYQAMRHELGHIFGLPDIMYDQFTDTHPEYKNNMMSLGSGLTKAQIDLIKFHSDIWFNYCKKELLYDQFLEKDNTCYLTKDSSCTQSLCVKSSGTWNEKYKKCDCYNENNEYLYWEKGKGCILSEKLSLFLQKEDKFSQIENNFEGYVDGEIVI